MDKPPKKRNSQSTQSMSSGPMVNLKRKQTSTSVNSKVTNNGNKNNTSISPRKAKLKKVVWSTNFLEVVPVESYKKYNNPDENHSEPNCRCTIF